MFPRQVHRGMRQQFDLMAVGVVGEHRVAVGPSLGRDAGRRERHSPPSTGRGAAASEAELDLAHRLNNYLDDIDEYRAITRNLLHLGGTITYEHRAIVVSLDRPDSPRVARAVAELVAELNDSPAVHLAGDQGPLTYQIRIH